MAIQKRAQIRRRERVILRTREDILNAAARAFARQDNPTMEDIAKEAGYTAPSLYTYFKSKEEISEALLQQIRQEVLKTFDEPVPAGLDLSSGLLHLLRRQLLAFDENSEAYRLLFRVAHDCQAGRKREKNRAGFVGQFAKCFADWLCSAGFGDELGGVSGEDLGYAFWGIQHGFLLRWLNASAESKLSDHAEPIVNLLTYGLCGRPKSEARSPKSPDTKSPKNTKNTKKPQKRAKSAAKTPALPRSA